MLETNTRNTTVEQALYDPKIKRDLLSHAQRLTKQQEDAEDLVQETIIKAREKQEKFKNGSNIRWRLYTIMYNTFINTYRKKTKHINIQENYFAEYTWHHTTYNEWESNIEYQSITEHIEHIKENLAKAFQLSYQWYEYKEIASLFNLPIWTVKGNIYKARQHIQKLLIKSDQDYTHYRKENSPLR